jgi:biotin synthase
MNRADVLAWLEETDESRLAELFRLADETREASVGDEVHLRGLIEVSSYCERQCTYCGLRRDHRALARYRLTSDEVKECANLAVRLGYGTVVLQSGEDDALTADWIVGLVREIRATTPLAITLSLGERPDDELIAFREAGADRYLLRFETSDPQLYHRIHPDRPGRKSDRIALLRRLRGWGYEIGSGVMVGIPGQTIDSLADDIETFRRLDLDMIGIGPFLPHPATPLGAHPASAGPRQAMASELVTLKMVALTRIVCPHANIPSTTALATIDPASGREAALVRGANIWMPNLTPVHYRESYEIYPGKACVHDDAQRCAKCAAARIRGLGRRIGVGRGDSPALHARRERGT